MKKQERSEDEKIMKNKAYLQFIISMIVFGTIGLAVVNIPASRGFVALVRGAVGSLFLLAFSFLTRRPPSIRAIKRNALWLFISGGLIGANWILLFESYRYSSVAASTLIYYLSPIFVMILCAILLGERITPVRALCAVAALGGMMLISGLALGSILALGAAVLYAIVVLINKTLIRDISPLDTTIVQLASAALCILPYVLITENPLAYTFSPRDILILAVVGIIHTGVAYLLYFAAVKGMKGQSIAILSYVDPTVAVLLSFLTEDSFSIPVLIGALIILSSAIISETIGNKKCGE